MLEMLMKQFMGDIDLTQVQVQFQNFANAFAQLLRDVEAIKATQVEILARLPSQAVPRLSDSSVDATQASNVTEHQGVDNEHGSDS